MANLFGHGHPAASSDGVHDDDVEALSPYELLRQERMHKNAVKLRELGLVVHPERRSTATKRTTLLAGQSAAKRRRGPAAIPLRASTRLASTPSASLPQTSLLQSSSSPPALIPSSKSSIFDSFASHIERAFENDARETAASREEANRCTWDSRKLHAHVTLSASKRTAATTGCAGYGCVLAARPSSQTVSKRDAAKYWEVEVVALGVGGFAVGLVGATWAGPFKSMARSDQCAGVYHSSGALLRNREDALSQVGAKSGSATSAKNGSPATEFPTYDAGDTVGVLWRENKGDVVFFKNGVEVGKVPAAESGAKKSISTGGRNTGDDGGKRSRSIKSSGSKPKCGFVLACQPYMGGVARISRAMLGPPSHVPLRCAK